ncbi:MAG TPA: Glu/Leu/Phe/Val dehydrogenase dimerization domain-containing protein, partial [Actinomycetota bacterium]
MFEELLRAWDGEEVALRHDAASGAWMFVCVHSTVLGPAAGGTRLKVYSSPADGLRDGLRLASAMTSKNAMAGVPLGGGKAVLAVPEIPQGPARRELLLRYGDLVESLHGTYWTACDMNTTPPDMDVVAER